MQFRKRAATDKAPRNQNSTIECTCGLPSESDNVFKIKPTITVQYTSSNRTHQRT